MLRIVAPQESFYEIREMGIEIQKEWVCTHDDRTRPSHLELDGERRDLDEEFSNGLQYPGDPDGDPSECTTAVALW